MAVVTATTMMMISSCSKADSESPEEPTVPETPSTPARGDNELKPITLTRAQQELVNGNNDFAFNLLRQITQSGPAGPCFAPPQSTIVSPISITFALGMLNNGAAGETQQQINNVLGFGVAGAEGINTFCGKMLTEASKLDTLTKVMIANTIYMNKGYVLQPTFVEQAKQYYDAEPETRDFGDGETRNVINKWGSDHTEGMISEVLNQYEFNSEAVSYLLNAIYFKGMWTWKFKKEDTREEIFCGEDGTQKKLPMMCQEARFSYCEDDLCQAVRLPYGNQAYSMTILLPREGKTVNDVLKSLTAETWRKYGAGDTVTVNLKIPRFESKTDVNLNDVMSQLGMPKAFTEYAEFPYFCNVSVYVGLMKQVARIKLDEEGTEAAAVTVIGLGKDGSTPTALFHATRPFLYVISERSTDAIFFVGEYYGD